VTTRVLAQRDSPSGVDIRRTGGESGVDRQSWIERCADRLAVLSLGAAGRGAASDATSEQWRRLATEMWEEVAMFDPVMAAEMEFEANQFDD
jgi:hypothetical protein